MARTFAKLLLSVNNDRDWWALTASARDLYVTLLIRPEISHCGIADWRPAKLASKSPTTTLQSVQRAADELVAARFIVIDHDSEEVLLRSFVRNDGILTGNPKGAGAVARAIGGAGSDTLVDVVLDEVQRLLTEQPELACWQPKNGGVDLVKLLANRRPIDSVSTSDRPRMADGVADRIGDVVGDGIDVVSTPDPLQPSAISLQPENQLQEPLLSATPSPTEKTPKTDSRRPEIQRLCDLLSDLVAERGSKRPKASAQYDPCRLMLDRDHRTVEQIEWLIRWSQNDDFWHQNIRSMAKLRDQWDTLRLKATAKRTSPGTTPDRSGRPRGSAFGMGWQADTTDRSAS